MKKDVEVQTAIAALIYAGENVAEALQNTGENQLSSVFYAKLEALEAVLEKFNVLPVLKNLL